jgi:hypothetical protein
MTDLLQYRLPKEIVDTIKLYTGEGCWRNGKYVNIYRIPNNDFRYTMLTKKPKIKTLCYDSATSEMMGSAWFKLRNGKFVVLNLKEKIYDQTPYYIWEMYYNQQVIQCIMH